LAGSGSTQAWAEPCLTVRPRRPAWSRRRRRRPRSR
jgi:hypothetical protein